MADPPPATSESLTSESAPAALLPHIKTIRSVIEYAPIKSITPPNRDLRRYRESEADAAATAIEGNGYEPPVLAARAGQLVHGAVYFEAYRRLGRSEIPVIYIEGRSPSEIARIKLSLDKIEHAGKLDLQTARAELEVIIETDPADLNLTAWEMGEIDVALSTPSDPEPQEDLLDLLILDCSRFGDIWSWPNGHRLICGNAREAETYVRLMQGRRAKLVVSDPPYGCKIEGNVSKRHGEFVEGSDVSEPEIQAIFDQSLAAMLPVVDDGAWVFLFMDGKSLYALITSIRAAGLDQKALICWDKMVGSRGGLYKNQCEFIVLAKWGTGPSVNNLQMGRFGVSRSTVWSVPGFAGFRPDRKEALAAHSTVKPLGVLMPPLLDASNIGDICLDPFCGSGSILLAAERTQRVAYGSELDPHFVDVAVARMHKLTGEHPVHAELGLPYLEVLAMRQAKAADASAPAGDEH